MTITDVAGLEALPVGTIVRLANGVLAERKDWYDGRTGLKESGAALGYQDGDWSIDFKYPTALRWVYRLPAEVLSPRTVTPEQVEAGARAIWESGAPPDDHEPWRVASDDDRADFRRDLIAGLAAMGIEVSDG